MDLNAVISAIQTIFSIVTSTTTSSTLSGVGLILLALAIGFSIACLKAQPTDTPLWVKIALFSTLVGGIVFSAAGPSVALFWFSEYPVLKISPETAFDHLQGNERVSWLIRLIPFDPNQQADLSIGKLKYLGPSEQKFAFVAPYDELVGYRVSDAVNMTGNTLFGEQRVSAIVFPVAGKQIFPANARGLLQVIQDVENDNTVKIEKPLLRGTSSLNDDELQDLKKNDSIIYWSWKQYGSKYDHYCKLAQQFRCEPNYSARKYIGGLNMDWHPLGFAQKDPVEPCSPTPQALCGISDWKLAKASLLPKFGSRAFLIKNFEISAIPNRIMIDFGNPFHQVIPNIGIQKSR